MNAIKMYERVKYFCAEKGIKIEDLENKYGLKPGSIENWKKEPPYIHQIVRIAVALNVSPFEITSNHRLNKLTLEEELLIFLYQHTDKTGKNFIQSVAIDKAFYEDET